MKAGIFQSKSKLGETTSERKARLVKKYEIHRIIEGATVILPGDPSVGIPRSEFTLELYFDTTGGADPVHTQLKNLRKKIEDVYEWMGGERAYVMFDFELRSEQIQGMKLEIEEGERLKGEIDAGGNTQSELNEWLTKLKSELAALEKKERDSISKRNVK